MILKRERILRVLKRQQTSPEIKTIWSLEDAPLVPLIRALVMFRIILLPLATMFIFLIFLHLSPSLPFFVICSS